MATSTDKKIEISDLYVDYGALSALRNINLDVYRNEILGIIGPAKSGKSTLLQAINRTIDFIPGARVRGSITVVVVNTDLSCSAAAAAEMGALAGVAAQAGMAHPKGQVRKALPASAEATAPPAAQPSDGVAAARAWAARYSITPAR